MIKSPVLNDIETLWHEMDKAFTGLRFTSPVAGLVEHAFGSYPSIRLHEGPEALVRRGHGSLALIQRP